MTDTSDGDLVAELQKVLDEKGIAVNVADFLTPAADTPAPADDAAPTPDPVDTADPTVTAESSGDEPTPDDSSTPPAPEPEEDESVTAPTSDPPASPVVQQGLDAVDTLRQLTNTPKPAPAGSATIDSSVTQGNRVTTQAKQEPNNPLKVLTDRVEDHFHNLSAIVADIEAVLERLKTLTNSIGVGL